MPNQKPLAINKTLRLLIIEYVVTFVVYTLVLYLMRERDQPFWTAGTIMQSSSFGFYMSLLAVTFDKNEPDVAMLRDVRHRRTFRMFITLLIAVSLFSTLINILVLALAAPFLMGHGYTFAWRDLYLLPLYNLMVAFVYTGIVFLLFQIGISWSRR